MMNCINWFPNRTEQQKKNGEVVSFIFDQFCKAYSSFLKEDRTKEEKNNLAVCTQALESVLRYFSDTFEKDLFKKYGITENIIQHIADNAPRHHIWE